MHISAVTQSYVAMQVPAPVTTNPADTHVAPPPKPTPAAVPQVAGTSASSLANAQGGDNTSTTVAQESKSVDFLA